jgi:aminoglycoside phosphotransferase (APT) family kinase protein
VIPVEVDDLTPAWCTEVLRRHAPGVTVTRVDVLDAHSGTTGRVRLGLTYAGSAGPGPDPDALPGSVFVKLAPFDARQRAFVDRVGIGRAEARLYATVGGEVPVRVPHVWHAEVDGDGRYVMVLEDLVASGCRFPALADASDPALLHRLVGDLAALHAVYWESGRFAPGGDLAWVPERAGFGDADSHGAEAAAAAGSFVARAVEKFGGEMGPAFRAVGTLYTRHTAAVLDLWDLGPRTLIHGDPHLGNLFVDRMAGSAGGSAGGSARLGFFDWGMASRSPGLRDVAYVLASSVPTEVRRAEERGLLAAYRAALAARGIAADAADVWRGYRRFSVYSWVSAVSTAAVGSRWQPEHAWRGGMQRATATIDDLDAAGLLAEELGVSLP